MRILVLLLILAAAGCISQAEPKAGCQETGCPVDLPPTTTLVHHCGDWNLTAPEECDVGYPCPNGTICQKCRCEIPKERINADECGDVCRGYGYRNFSLTDDGGCNYNFGVDKPCAVRCAYRNITALTESGKVCCCRDLKYINCKVDVLKKKCECPTKSETVALCAMNKPDINATT